MPSTVYAQAKQQVTDEIWGIVKAQWVAEIADPANLTEQFKNITEGDTEFNNDYSTRIEVKALAMRLRKDPNL